MAKDTSLADTDKAEQIGFHKGSLTTLAKEREAVLGMLQVVEQLMQMHLKALKDMGVDLEAESKKKKQPLEAKL